MVWVYTGTDEWEHTTPILSLSHDIFTERSTFRIPFFNAKERQFWLSDAMASN